MAITLQGRRFWYQSRAICDLLLVINTNLPPILHCFHWLSCKAFIGLSIRAKMIGGGRFLLHENLVDTDLPRCKIPIFNLFLLEASQP